MSFFLKPNIFKFFGNYAKSVDTFKDGNGKGIWERYQESLGESYDNEVQPLLDLFAESVIVPETILSKLIPTMERVLGEPVIVLQDGSQPDLTELLRRKILRFANQIYNIRSTELSYQVLINLLGFATTSITEFQIATGFDSPETFDDPQRVFDSSVVCGQCKEYTIATTGGIVLDSNIIAGLRRIIDFLEPINAQLREFTYNGDVIELFTIEVFIQDGVLYYDNANDPGITLSLIDGVLNKDGLSADDYTFDDTDGKLYLIT